MLTLTFQFFLESMTREPYWSHASRDLKSRDAEVDYSILAVLVVTLALVLCVELVRHQLDHYAEHRQLLRCVLKGVYEERKNMWSSDDSMLVNLLVEGSGHFRCC